MLLTRYGLREWLTITVLAAVAAAPLTWFGRWWLVAMVAVIWFALAMFFRDPLRRIPTGLAGGTMLSPADGRVSAIERVDHHDTTDGPAIIVRIFLSVLNVHVNRAPCEGRVVAVRHAPGQYLNAQTAESARVNENTVMTLRTSAGGSDETIGIKQIAGMIARRIVCGVDPGDTLAQGQRFGMIKFGSTTELILPRPNDVEVLVAVGDRVRGGLTKLAVLEKSDDGHQPTGRE